MAANSDTLTGADVFLEILRGAGVEFIFASPGTEWAPLWESLARQKAQGILGPKYICARHEDVAIGMASGYAKATGQLGVCLVHSTVGSLRIAMGVRGAYQAQVPLLVCAGESITYGESEPWVGFHWGRYLADYGGPARVMETVVKSSFGVNHPALFAGSVHRACHLAMASAPGPVFLSLPFEYMAQPAIDGDRRAVPFPVSPRVDAGGLARAAAWLKESRSPLIVTERIGRNPAAVEALVTVAERLGAVVVESQHPEYMNFPRRHDLHGGFDPRPYLTESDVILVLDAVGAPWYPETALRPAQARVIVVGEDPLRARVPYNGIDSDLVLQGRADLAVLSLAEQLAEPVAEASQRRQRWQGVHRAKRERWHRAARDQAAATPIDARFLCESLNEVLPENAIVVDETILTNFTMLHVMDQLPVGGYINGMDGGLGTGLGAALGVKVAHPDRPVVAVIGDGGFNYNAPLAVLGLSQEYGVPITIVIGNNSRYRAMQMVTEQLYPEGAAVRTNNYYGSFLLPRIRYADLAGLIGGHGETVSDPTELPAALRRALSRTAAGQLSIIDVHIDDELKYLGTMMQDGE